MTALALALTAAFGVASPARAQDNTVSISIAAQPLGDALLKLGEQTPLQIFFAPDLVAGQTARPVSGALTPEAALQQLLQGTGIQYARNGNNVTLSSSAQAAAEATRLGTVTVSGGILGDLSPAYAGGQVATGGSMGILGAENVMDTPFSTVNYTSDLLFEQQARTLADVIVNDPSVRSTTSTGGFGEDFVIRGFPVSSNYGLSEVSVNGLYGLVAPSRLPVQIMERVELLKGPGTLMRGMSPNGNVGGSVNIVTKRADDEPLNRVTLGYMSEANLTAQLDMGRRFGEDNAWGLRFNGMKRGGEATTKNGDQGLEMMALGVDYRGDRLRWSMDLIHQEDVLKNVRSQIGLATGVVDLPSPPDGDINFFPGTRLSQRDSTIMSRLEYDFTDSVTGHIGMGYREGKNRQVFPGGTGMDAQGNFTASNRFYDTDSETFSGDAGIVALFDTGAIGHRLALGATYFAQEQGISYSDAPAGIPAVPSNIYNPVPLPAGPSLRVDPERASKTHLISFAITDTLSFAQDSVLLTLGARRQTVDTDSYSYPIVNAAGVVGAYGNKTGSYRASAISPVVGLVIKPIENVSLYANYTEGLSKGMTVGLQRNGTPYANTGAVLKPYKSKQYEAGIKVDWGTITTTAALWQIEKPFAVVDASNVYDYSGKQRNRGLELNAYGEIQRGLRLMAGASFIDSKLRNTQGGTTDGNRSYGVPASAYNLGLDWDTPWVNGLSLDGRMIRTSSMYFDNANQISLPGTTIFNVGARYRTEIAGKDVVFRATIDNLTDKRYWLVASNAYATNAAGRTFMLSASVDF